VKVKRPKRPVERDDWREHLNRRLRTEFIAGRKSDPAKTSDEA
jgi:hypothetical protein